jgi:hypothetical protein
VSDPSELKVGDAVVLRRSNGRDYEIREVERVTATQIALRGYHARFRRDTGRQIGDRGYWTCEIDPAPDAMDRARRRLLERRMRAGYPLSVEGFEAMRADIREAEALGIVVL